MFHLNVFISNLNYKSVISFADSLLKDKLPKGLLGFIPEFMKANIIVNSINNNHIKIENALQSFVEKNEISFQVENLKMSRLDGTRNFTLNIDIHSLDYLSFIKKFLPMLKLDSVQNEMNKYLNLFLPVLFNKLDDVEKIVNAIDDSEKERFIAFMVNKNSIKIIDAIYPLIGKKGLQFSIDSLSLEASKE